LALVTAFFAFTVGRMVRNEYGPVLTLLASLLSAVLPFVHITTACVLVDPLVALLSTWAIIVYGRYLDDPSLRRGAAFGLLASAAILTKGNAAALGLMVPFAVALGRHWDLWKRLSFWLPAFLVLAICAPWYLATWHMAQGGLETLDPSAGSLLDAIIAPVRAGLRAFGPLMTGFAAVGIALTLRRGREGDGTRQSLVGFLLAFVLLHAFALSGSLERRYLIAVVPVVVVFLLDGAAWLAAKAPVAVIRQQAGKAVSLLVAGIVVSLVAGSHFPNKSCRGYGDVAEFLLSQPETCQKPILICSDAPGEGMFVAETLLRDTERNCMVLRGSKVFASSPWNGGQYVAFVRSPEDVAELLERLNVGVIVIDASVPEQLLERHDGLLAEALRSPASNYRLLRSDAVTRRQCCYQDGLRIYVSKNPAGGSSNDVRIDMRHNLDGPIKARVSRGGVEVIPRAGADAP
jgi:4-amino-4-deoxy-L-arabinose transferase-like glycosyltransferase